MKLRLASLLLTLALPLTAQDPLASEAEVMFYKAFYLEKAERDHLGAMDLYQKFLEKAPDHKLAAKAAQNNFALLGSAGMLKERDAFKAKYEKLLGNMANAPVPATAERGGAGAGPGRGAGAGRGERGAGPGRPDAQARIAQLQAEIAKAKEEGNDERVKELEASLQRARQAGNRGERGAGGPGGRRGGLMGVLANDKKVADMTAEELTTLKEALAGSTRMIEMMRNGGREEAAAKLETNIDSLKKALDANKTEDAQKALDAVRTGAREAMQRGGRGGGDAGGGRGGRGGEGGGRGGEGGGNRGGGGGGGAGGGGGNRGGGGGGGGGGI
jgi:hypothetical protein